MKSDIQCQLVSVVEQKRMLQGPAAMHKIFHSVEVACEIEVTWGSGATRVPVREQQIRALSADSLNTQYHCAI